MLKNLLKVTLIFIGTLIFASSVFAATSTTAKGHYGAPHPSNGKNYPLYIYNVSPYTLDIEGIYRSDGHVERFPLYPAGGDYSSYTFEGADNGIILTVVRRVDGAVQYDHALFYPRELPVGVKH